MFFWKKRKNEKEVASSDKYTGDKYVEKNIKLIATIIIFVAIITQLCMIIIDVKLGDVYSTSAIYKGVTLLLNNATITLLAIGIGSILLDFFGFVDYMKLRIRDIIIEDEFINMLNTNEKSRLKQKLEKDLMYPGIENIGEDSLYYAVQKELMPILTQYYIDEYIVTVECEIKENCILKKIHKKITYRNLRDGEIILEEPPLGAQIKKIEGEEDSSLYTLEEFIFDGKSMKEKIKLTYNVNERSDKYDVMVSCQFDDDFEMKFKKQTTLNITTHSKVSFDDTNFIQRVDKPCKSYCIHFHYDKKDCDVSGEGFGFMDTISKETNSLAEYRFFDSCRVIRFNNWILPGDGVMFTIKPKCK